jgi:hypothetical protein
VAAPATACTDITITTTVLSAPPLSIALSTSGLPAGVTGHFNPDNVATGSSSALTVSADYTAVPGGCNHRRDGEGKHRSRRPEHVIQPDSVGHRFPRWLRVGRNGAENGARFSFRAAPGTGDRHRQRAQQLQGNPSPLMLAPTRIKQI